MNSTPENYQKFTTGCICRVRDDNSVYVCGKCRYACCDEAKTEHCVCLYSFSCEKHKIIWRCKGSHS